MLKGIDSFWHFPLEVRCPATAADKNLAISQDDRRIARILIVGHIGDPLPPNAAGIFLARLVAHLEAAAVRAALQAGERNAGISTNRGFYGKESKWWEPSVNTSPLQEDCQEKARDLGYRRVATSETSTLVS